MNYLLTTISRLNYPINLGHDNKIKSSDLDLGKFFTDLPQTPFVYNDAQNSDVSFDILTSKNAIESVSGGVLVSRRVKSLLEEYFPQEVQYFDTEVNYKGQFTNDYFVFNVYNKIECYDLEKSEYSIHSVDRSYQFRKIVPITTPLEEYGYEYNIVRCVYDNRIVVSEAVKKLLETHRILGFGFKKQYP